MRHWPLMLTAIFALMQAFTAHADESEVDLSPIVIDSTLLQLPDTIEGHKSGTYAENDWKHRLRTKNLDVTDRSIRWPSPFIGWCIGAYNWINRTFNYHDPAWVRREGYNFKALLLSDNWLDAYQFNYKNFPSLRMMDRVYPNLGVYLKFLGLSVGYSVDMETILTGEKSAHRKLSLSLSCATFMLEGQLWRSNVSTYIRGYGKFDFEHPLKVRYNGFSFDEANVSAYYFFNHNRFTLAAVHSYANNQRRSVGSAIIGASMNFYGANFDFRELANELPDFQKYPFDTYNFHYRTYNLMGGYSYNWVLSRRWVFNITAIPGIGVTKTAGDSTIGKDVLLSVYGKGLAGILYSYRRLFVGLRGAVMFNLFTASDVTFMNTLQNYQLAIGIKF